MLIAVPGHCLVGGLFWPFFQDDFLIPVLLDVLLANGAADAVHS